MRQTTTHLLFPLRWLGPSTTPLISCTCAGSPWFPVVISEMFRCHSRSRGPDGTDPDPYESFRLHEVGYQIYILAVPSPVQCEVSSRRQNHRSTIQTICECNYKASGAAARHRLAMPSAWHGRLQPIVPLRSRRSAEAGLGNFGSYAYGMNWSHAAFQTSTQRRRGSGRQR